MLSDVTFSTEGIATITVLMVALCGAIGALFKMMMKEKDERLAEMKDQRDDYKKIGISSTEVAEHVVHKALARKGLSPVANVPAVEPEHNSPVTQKQEDQAEFATLQARRRALLLEASRLDEAATDHALPEPPPQKVEVVSITVPLEVKATEPVPVKVVDEDKKP